MAKLSQDDIKNVKGQGFLINRGTEMFSGRVLPGNGVFTAKEMMKIAECAEKFGNGKITMTSRLAVNCPAFILMTSNPPRLFWRKKVCCSAVQGRKSVLWQHAKAPLAYTATSTHRAWHRKSMTNIILAGEK